MSADSFVIVEFLRPIAFHCPSDCLSQESFETESYDSLHTLF